MEKSGVFTAGLGAIAMGTWLGLGAIATWFDIIWVAGFTLIAGIIGPELPASSLRIVFGATGIAEKQFWKNYIHMIIIHYAVFELFPK